MKIVCYTDAAHDVQHLLVRINVFEGALKIIDYLIMKI